MNKKVLTVFAVTLLAVPACAQQTGTFMPKHWQDALKQKVDYSTFENSINTLSKPLLLIIPVTKQYFYTDGPEADIPFTHTARYRQLETVETYPSQAGCKAYVLDEHWVMAGATCLWNGRHTVEFTDKSGKFATGLVEPNTEKKNLFINGTAITWKNNLFVQPHAQQAPHVILVRVPESTSLGKHLKKWPKINILAFEKNTPQDLVLWPNGHFYINTARFGLNVNRQRTIQKVENGTVTLQDRSGDLSGVSTDPLAYIQNGQLHWVGVNQGITKLYYGNLANDWDGQTSNDYFYFTKDDADFIKNTISKYDPAAWQRIEKRKGLEIL